MILTFAQATNKEILSIPLQPHQADWQMVYLGKKAFAEGLVPLDGTAIAIRKDEKCIGAYGYIELWPGVIQMWAMFSEDLIKNHPLALGRRIKSDLARAEKQSKARRVEATASADHEAAINFLEWLGFEKEGLMRRYSPNGKDLWIFSRIHDDAS